MKNKMLQIKKVLRTALLVLLLGVFGMGDVFADGYDYAEVCPSGQMLYYKIDPEDPNSVIVVPPYYYYFQDGPHYEFWGEGYEKPVGDVIIPDRLSNDMVVKNIGYNKRADNAYSHYGAFEGCTEITSVTMGNALTTISYTAFRGCTGLTAVTIGNSVTKIGACINEYNEGAMSEGVFGGCSNLTSVTMGDAVSYIGYHAFCGCTSLTSVTLPNSVTTIDYGAFQGCSSLVSFIIPNSVTSISLNAFEGTGWYNEQSDGVLYLDTWCLGYKGEKPTGALDIREGTRGISWMAFKDCEGITSVSFPNSLVSIVEYAFEDTGLTGNLTIPESVAYIGSCAFEGTDLTGNLTIPKSVAYIGGSAFSECSRLTSIYYNAEDAECNQAFGWCSNLATLMIGPDVRNVDGNAFKRCNTVHLVVALGATPAVLGPDAFSDLAENAMLMVPCGKKMTYFSQWNMFPYDNILENCDQNPVTMGNISTGGSITASTTNAQMGEEVQLTVTPNAGMALASISISNANDPTQTIPYYFVSKAALKIGFIMPQFGVTVNAVFKTSGASVGESNNVAVSVYPNPTNGQVKIEAEGLKQITISNMVGQIIYEGKASGNEFQYDFGKHGVGLYLIRIETASGLAVKKVSVTR